MRLTLAMFIVAWVGLAFALMEIPGCGAVDRTADGDMQPVPYPFDPAEHR